MKQKVTQIKDVRDLERGDVIRHLNGLSFVVIRSSPDVVAVRDVNVTNASEWLLVRRETT